MLPDVCLMRLRGTSIKLVHLALDQRASNSDSRPRTSPNLRQQRSAKYYGSELQTFPTKGLQRPVPAGLVSINGGGRVEDQLLGHHPFIYTRINTLVRVKKLAQGASTRTKNSLFSLQMRP